jgi:hypothetical protein
MAKVSEMKDWIIINIYQSVRYAQTPARMTEIFQEKIGPPPPSIGLVIALCPQTSRHVRGGWSHYTDTSEPVDGNGA